MREYDLDIFSFESFDVFLKNIVGLRGKRGGLKREIASAMGGHQAALSRILAGQAKMTLEQSEKITRHFQMDSDETRFVLFLLEEDRAGSADLKLFFRKEREKIRDSRLTVKERIPPSKKINQQDQALYYSAWYYQAIHVLACIPTHKNVNTISQQLHLPTKLVSEVLSHLERMNLIIQGPDGWIPGEMHLHLDRTSEFLRQHHTNWRNQSIHRLDLENENDLRYSGVFSMSRTDARILRERLLSQLHENLKHVQNSDSETVYAYCFDLFQI